MGFSQVAVLASAQTELRPAWNDAQHIDLISSVVTNVFKGTGLTLDDVDFIIDSGSDVLDGRSISNCGFLGALGAHHKEEARVEEDGLWGALYGVNKIRSGASKIGLIVAYSKPSESSIDLYWSAMVEPFYQRPVGFGQKAALGIQAQRYLAAHGITDRELADLVARRWAAAAGNGGVAIDSAPDADAVLGAGEAASPLTNLMLSRPVDGAVAVLLGAEDVARRTGRPPVFITGMGTSMETHAFAERSANTLDSVGNAAKMALAAGEQGRYAAFHKAMFAAGRPDASSIAAAASAAGLDPARANRVVAAAATEQELVRNLDLAHKLGFTGTPSWVIGDTMLTGAVGPERLAEAIDDARNRAPG